MKNVRSNLDGSRIIRIPIPPATSSDEDPAAIVGQMIESVDGDEWGITDEGVDVKV